MAPECDPQSNPAGRGEHESLLSATRQRRASKQRLVRWSRWEVAAMIGLTAASMVALVTVLSWRRPLSFADIVPFLGSLLIVGFPIWGFAVLTALVLERKPVWTALCVSGSSMIIYLWSIRHFSKVSAEQLASDWRAAIGWTTASLVVGWIVVKVSVSDHPSRAWGRLSHVALAGHAKTPDTQGKAT